MIAGEPGSYKSTFALNLLVALMRKGVTGLYVSAEDDDTIMAKRIAAIMTGDDLEEVGKTIRTGGYAAELKELSSHVAFEFKSLRVSDIAERMQAFRKVYGAMPQVVYIDNLMSMVDDPSDYHGQLTMVRDLAQVAATAPTPVHVMVLHHTKEHPEKPKNAPRPPPRFEIHGKVSQFPKLILTLDTVGGDGRPDKHMGIAPVKNTDGPDDKTGRTYLDFAVWPQSARVLEM